MMALTLNKNLLLFKDAAFLITTALPHTKRSTSILALLSRHPSKLLVTYKIV